MPHVTNLAGDRGLPLGGDLDRRGARAVPGRDPARVPRRSRDRRARSERRDPRAQPGSPPPCGWPARWDESLEETAAVTELLGDQRDDPPYFAMHTFGAAAMIHQARGEQAEARRLLETMAKAASLSSGRTYPSLVRVLVERGELDRAWAVERPWNWRVHCTDALFAEAQRSRRERSMGPRARPRGVDARAGGPRPRAAAGARGGSARRVARRSPPARTRRRSSAPRWRGSMRWASRTSGRGRSCTWPRHVARSVASMRPRMPSRAPRSPSRNSARSPTWNGSAGSASGSPCR